MNKENKEVYIDVLNCKKCRKVIGMLKKNGNWTIPKGRIPEFNGIQAIFKCSCGEERIYKFKKCY